MRSQTHILSKAFIAMLILPACASGGGEPVTSGTAGTAGMATGTGGTHSGTGGTSTGSAGTSSSTGGTSTGSAGTTSGTGTGGTSTGSGGTTSGTGTGGTSTGSGGTNSGTGTGGSSAAGSNGTGSGGSAVAGTSGSAGTGGTNGGTTGATGGARMFAKPVTSVPTQYGNNPTSQGKWTSTTYPCYYHGQGSVGQMIAKQSTPITKSVNIYTPPGYDAQNQYPLVFFLHGYPDNQDTWMQRARIKPNVLLDNLINEKVIKPIIGVWPMGSSTGNSNDTGGYMVFDNEMMNDLIPFLESKYSISKDRNMRAVSGFSYGGMQTINVFLCHHLKDFGWFGGYSPAGGNYGSDMIASCLKQEDPAMNPVNYFYVQWGSNELATSSAAASANGLATKAAPAITNANFSSLVTGGGHDYDNCTIGLYNFVRIAFPY